MYELFCHYVANVSLIFISRTFGDKQPGRPYYYPCHWLVVAWRPLLSSLLALLLGMALAPLVDLNEEAQGR